MLSSYHAFTLSSFIKSEATTGFDDAYYKALAYNREIGGTRGIDDVLKSHNLAALVMPSIWGYVATPAGLSNG